VIDDLCDLVGGKRTTHSAPFSKLPIWRNYATTRPAKPVYLDASGSYIRARISMPLHAHARERGLNDGHFDRFLGHFREALNEVGVRPIRWRRSEGHQTS
jgi:hypothetical protein